MDKWLERTATFLGEDAVNDLKNKTVAVLGLGGVGGAVAEALCRSGIGSLVLVDNDDVDITNLNRQIITNINNVGKNKCDEAEKRLLSINPNIKIYKEKQFYLPENSEFLYKYSLNYIVDAIDTVTAKLHLAQTASEKGIPMVMCLGTGNRIEPSNITWGDIKDTSGCGCPLARVIRRELRKRGVEKLDVVYSLEIPSKTICGDGENGRHSPASISFVPPVAGYTLASVVIRKLLNLI